MSDSWVDLDDDVEAAWARFRVRLGDRLASMDVGDAFVIELETAVDEDDLAGRAPYVQFIGSDQDVLRAEVASNLHLDERFALTEVDEGRLADFGWELPSYDEGDEDFYVLVEPREADRVAVMSVQVLREVHGCAHPVFLSAEGLELDPDESVPVTLVKPDEVDEEIATFPTNQKHLQEMVDRAIAAMFDSPVEHDVDGDIPVSTGRSVIYVRIGTDRPSVDLFSYVLQDVDDGERAELELSILNHSHPSAKFSLREDHVQMRQQISAWPFAPEQLRDVLARMMKEIDELAHDLSLRVGGRGSLYGLGVEVDDDESEDGPIPSMGALLELLADGPVAAGMAANVFHLDDDLIVRQIARLKADPDEAGVEDVESLIRLLRRALRIVVKDRAERNATSGRKVVPPRPSTQQAS